MIYCSKCQTPRNVKVSESRREIVDPEGETKEILTKSYHCEVCHTFVRSEDIEETEEVIEKK